MSESRAPARERILVVEDEAFVGLEIKDDLERMGYEVPELVTRGEEVLGAVERHSPDLLLMDIRLQGELDGIEAATMARTGHDLPVIFLTAYSDSDTLQRVAKIQPDGFLLKPFSEAELLANVRLALAKHGSGDSLRSELRSAMALSSAIEDPVLIIDHHGVVAHANAAALALVCDNAEGRNLVGFDVKTILDLPLGLAESRTARLLQEGADSQPITARIERLTRADGLQYGYLATFSTMNRQERRLLEDSAAQVNATLISYLPARDALGEGYSVGGFLRPCPSGSGDLCGTIDVGDGQYAFYGLDVMGHGPVASLLASSLHDILPDIARDGELVRYPAEVLELLSEKYFRTDSSGTRFFTIDYGLLDAATGGFRIARAGHSPALKIGTNGDIGSYGGKGMAIGLARGIPAEESVGRILPGERLILPSDGLVESFAGEETLVAGLEALGNFAAQLREKDMDQFLLAFNSHLSGSGSCADTLDDVSLLVIERK